MKYVICYLFLGCPKRHITISSPPPPEGFVRACIKNVIIYQVLGGGCWVVVRDTNGPTKQT